MCCLLNSSEFCLGYDVTRDVLQTDIRLLSLDVHELQLVYVLFGYTGMPYEYDVLQTDIRWLSLNGHRMVGYLSDDVHNDVALVYMQNCGDSRAVVIAYNSYNELDVMCVSCEHGSVNIGRVRRVFCDLVLLSWREQNTEIKLCVIFGIMHTSLHVVITQFVMINAWTLFCLPGLVNYCIIWG
jgi:hypothetical protein